MFDLKKYIKLLFSAKLAIDKMSSIKLAVKNFWRKQIYKSIIKRKVGRQKYVQSKKIYQSIFICKVSLPKNVKRERNIKELLSVKLAVKNMFQVKKYIKVFLYVKLAVIIY